MNKKPNYIDLGLSSPMSPILRKLVEHQLLEDLTNYNISTKNLKFDWSESCIEGHLSDYLDSSLENYSGITVYNEIDELVADGWMEYINDYNEETESNFFLVYWDFLDVNVNGTWQKAKSKPGIPKHIWKKLPINLKVKFQNQIVQ